MSHPVFWFLNHLCCYLLHLVNSFFVIQLHLSFTQLGPILANRSKRKTRSWSYFVLFSCNAAITKTFMIIAVSILGIEVTTLVELFLQFLYLPDGSLPRAISIRNENNRNYPWLPSHPIPVFLLSHSNELTCWLHVGYPRRSWQLALQLFSIPFQWKAWEAVVWECSDGIQSCEKSPWRRHSLSDFPVDFSVLSALWVKMLMDWDEKQVLVSG